MKRDRWSDEETNDPLYAGDRNFYKVELWTEDEQHIIDLLYAGNNLIKPATSCGSSSSNVRMPI